MKRIGWLLLLCALLFSAAPAVLSAQLRWDPKEFMGVDEIQPGMVGYGKTVYQGTKIETFGVQVIGVLKKVDFGFDMILVKLTSGPVVTRKLQTVAGMSGSPIYINNRLIGAYAYGWDFQQEPIAGVTPIAAMLECTQPNSAKYQTSGTLQPANHVLKIGDKLISRVRVAGTPTEAEQAQAKADPTTMVLTPVASPLFVSGMSDAALKPLQKLFAPFNLQAMPGPGQMPAPAGASDKLEPGSAVAVSLMEGDVNLSAVGTVTYVKGDTVLAFGHPFMGIGKVNMPMSTAYVQGIVNSSQSSFKLASPMTRVGTLTSDRQFAVAGAVGQKPDTLPVRLRVYDESRKFARRYDAEMVQDPLFTPSLLYMYVLTSGASQMADFSSAEGTFSAHTTLETDKLGTIEQRMVVAPQAGQSMAPMSEFYLLADSLMQNPYERINITNAQIDIAYQPERNIATIEKVTPDRTVAHPGETVNLLVKIRPYGKPVETRTVRVTVPKTTTEPMMMMVVAGGTHAMMLKQQLLPTPSPEEGVTGIVRWLTENPSAQTMITAQVLPTPSYAYHGRLLNDVPLPLIDLLRLGDTGGLQTQMSIQAGANGDGSPSGSSRVRPATYVTVLNEPYVLSGGQVLAIAIDTPEQQNGSASIEGFGTSARVPVLSAAGSSSSDSDSEVSGDDQNGGDEANEEGLFPSAYWLTPQQRSRFTTIMETIVAPVAKSSFHLSLPWHAVNHANAKPAVHVNGVAVRQAGADQEEAANAAPVAAEEKAPADEAGDDQSSDSPEKPAEKALLTKSRPSWGLTSQGDFQRGTHLGTTANSQGNLVLAPKVRSIYQSTEMLPWRIVTTENGTYVAGWNTAQVVRILADGKSEVVFPRTEADAGKAETVTALAADAAGNLLVGTWPDQRVRLVTPNGNVTREWSIPGERIWDIAVASDGKRYVAADAGTLYLLRDEKDSPAQAVATVPDKNVYALATGEKGDIYLATMPRGKVYRLSAGKLTAAYEGEESIASLVVDKAGNLYVGTSPNCTVYRVAVDGTKTKILTGVGTGNRHVLDLLLVGDDLYAATGPTGGIYRISHPASQQPVTTVIYARQDERTGTSEQALAGPESVMVNSLAATATGTVLAATSSPGQVLALEPRTEGVYLSAVLPAPAVSQWGQLVIQRENADKAQVRVETRSGFTALPDETWSAWEPVRGGALIASPKATYLQFRITMKDDPAGQASVDYVRAYYVPVNQTPLVKLQQPTSGAFLHEDNEVKWAAKDPDNDQLIYTVFASSDGTQWKQLALASEKKADEKTSDTKADEKKDAAGDEKPDAKDAAKPDTSPVMETSDPSFKWDTTTLPDGKYRLKVVASDRYAKPADPKSAESISGVITIDNTVPTSNLAEHVTDWDAVKRFQVIDNLTPVLGGKYRIDGGTWIALVAADGVFDSLQEDVLLLSPNGQVTLATGEHKLEILAEDAAGNQLDRTVTIDIK